MERKPNDAVKMKVNSFYIFLVVLLLSGFFSGHRHFENRAESGYTGFSFSDSLSAAVNEEVENTLKSLTLEEKVGQVILTHFNGRNFADDDPRFQRLVHLINDLKIGGGICYKGEVSEQVKLLNRLQGLSKIPLLFSADYERAISSDNREYFSLPYNMAIGAANDSALTYYAGRELARQSRLVGIHQIYAPVVDVNNEPANPVINMRSYGENPGLVAKLGAAFIKGIQDGGCIATAKHFPGHGNTSVDSHLDLPVINADMDNLEKTEFIPFRAAVATGVGSIMTGHLALPRLDSSNTPASISPILTYDLLRNKLNFSGLIVTDALTMKAISKKYNAGEAALMAFLAGNDLLLMPEDEDSAYIALLDACRSGVISESRLNTSVRKIIEAKYRLGLFEKRTVDDIPDSGIESYRSITGLALARGSVTLLSNKDKFIPLKNPLTKPVIHISLKSDLNDERASIFSSELLRRDSSLNTLFISDISNKKQIRTILDSARKHNKVILSLYSKAGLLNSNDKYLKQRKDFVNKILAANRNTLVAVHGTPYELKQIGKLRNCILNYGDTEVSEIALAEAIFGEQNISGKLPVSVPKTEYRYGSGLIIPKAALTNESRFIGKPDVGSIEKVIETAIADSAFPGASLMIIKDGKILLQRGFGRFTYEENSSEVDVNTIFDMASVSKVLATTTAAMICIDRKLFSLNDPVKKYIPSFGVNGKAKILIKNLLVHNSGLPAFKRYYTFVKTGEEVLKDIYSSKLDYTTGSKTVYSDLGMITLGKIIEKVTKKSLDRFCSDEIFTPLGMHSTFYNPAKELYYRIAPTENDTYWRNRLLIGTVHDETADLLGGVAGHAGLFSTTGDIAKLLQMILQGGEYGGRSYIKPETVKLFTTRVSSQSSRAIGWDTNFEFSTSAGKAFSETSYGHTGYTGTSVWTDPEKKIIVILLTNRVYPTRENLRIQKYRTVLHEAVIKYYSGMKNN